MTALFSSTVLCIALFTASSPMEDGRPHITVGSKKFTESVILGEIIAHLARYAGGEVNHRRELGGSRILFNALLNGDVDIYPEYTGTISEEILFGQGLRDENAIRKSLAQQGIRMSRPLGFNNTYALGMKKARAAEFGIDRISDLLSHVELKFGFTSEFMNRGDGWPSLRERYRLPHRQVRGLDHDIAYRGLENGALDVIDLYSTDAEIRYYDLKVLTDDLGHFPVYDAVLLYREDLALRAPEFLGALHQLEGRITAANMTELNKRAKIDKLSEAQVAADFITHSLQIHSLSPSSDTRGWLWQTTVEHLSMVLKSMTVAILVAVPLGIWAAKRPGAAQPILAIVGIIQTVPALALLVLIMQMLKPLKPIGVESLGEHPAIVALFLYSLLPIVRNTYAGLHDIPPHIRESAAALGLPSRARLWRVELPMASRMILAGIKTAVVINVGFATLGALIGAGGYGQPILAGIRRDELRLILRGAVPAALLALLAQGLFELAEWILVPKGLRLGPKD